MRETPIEDITGLDAPAVPPEPLPERPSVSVVVPAYNEEAILEDSLQTLYLYLETITDRYRWEIVIVDDGSSDRTGEIADRFAAAHTRCRVLHHHINFKLGQALRYAFNTCTGDYVVTLDADLTYSADHVGRLLDEIVRTRAKIVIASAFAVGGKLSNVPRGREVMSRMANWLLSVAVKGQLTTLTGMVRAYDRPFLSSLNLKAMDIEINSEIIYKARVLRATIVEIPAHLDWSNRTAPDSDKGERVSSLRPRRSAAAYIFSSFLFRPMFVFVLPGTILFGLASVLLGIAAYITWFGNINNHPGYILAGGVTLVLSTQLLIVGLLAIQAKRYFEELFHLGTSILRTTRGDPHNTGQAAAPVTRLDRWDL